MMWLKKLFLLLKEQALVYNRSLSVCKFSSKSPVNLSQNENSDFSNKTNQGPFIGIDFGATKSCVAVFDGDIPKILENKELKRKQPSLVTITNKGMANIGKRAKHQLLNIPDNTMFSTQRLLAEWLDQSENQIYKQNINNPLIKEKIYAYILGKLKDSAESYLKTSVHGAVISHSEHDGDLVKSAAKNAGFVDVETIEEPLAIAIASGYNNHDKITAIYDLGGKKFNIAIVKDFYKSGMIVESKRELFGGNEYDDVLTNFFREQFKKEIGIDISENHKMMPFLRYAALDAKIQLSQATEVEIKFPLLIDNSNFTTRFISMKLTRKQFENVIHDMLQKTFSVSKELIEKSKTDLEDIDEVILLGGMSKIPIVRKMVEEFFRQKPSSRINPDGIVAVGALLHKKF